MTCTAKVAGINFYSQQNESRMYLIEDALFSAENHLELA